MRVALGIPVFGMVPGEALPSMLRLAVEIGRLGEVAIVVPIDQSPHERARNYIMETSLGLDCQWLMFMDTDNTIPNEAFQKLLSLAEKGSVITAGHYVQRGYPFMPTWGKIAPGGTQHHFTMRAKEGREGVEIDSCGMGCTLINLEWVRDNLPPGGWFKKEEGPKGVTGEDTFFCMKVAERGGGIMGHTDVRCGHLSKREEITDENAEGFRKLHLEAVKALQAFLIKGRRDKE